MSFVGSNSEINIVGFQVWQNEEQGGFVNVSNSCKLKWSKIIMKYRGGLAKIKRYSSNTKVS